MRIGLLSDRMFRDHQLGRVQPILADRQFEIALVLVDARPPKPAGRKVIEHLKKGCGAYLLVMAIQSFFAEPARGLTAAEFCRRNHVECLETAQPYSPETCEQIRARHLDLLVLVNSFGKRGGEAGFSAACDFDSNSAVDVYDLLVMVNNFGE